MHTISHDMQENFFLAYRGLLTNLAEYSQSHFKKDSFFSLPAEEEEEPIDAHENLLHICEPQLVEELDEFLVKEITQDQCQLEVVSMKQQEWYEINLLDLRFNIGSHIVREQNASEYIQPFRITPDGLI